ncbi:MAG: MlaD family protein [Egibacteraceae bacterium]
MRARTLANAVAVAAAAIVLLTYAAAQLLAGAVLDDRYDLYVELPRGGGLLPDKEVTYNGHGVGQVADMELVGEVVRLRLLIEAQVRVPRDVDVVVQRSSAIGEQVLDLRPRAAITEATAFHEPGDTLAIADLRLPPEVQQLLALAGRVLEPIDKADAGTVVAELADVVRGRGDDLRGVLRDSATLSEQLADAGTEFDRFFASSRVVNRTLAEHRETLAGLVVDVGDAATILSDMRTEFEGVLADAPPTLALAGDLVDRSQPNLSCSLRDLANLNAYVARPEVLHDTAEALRLNRLFFDGFATLTQLDPFGGHWQRLRLELRDEGHGHPYEPKRPTPPILPGGACTSPFGAGAPAATEPGHVPLVTDSAVVPPEDAREEPVRRPARTGATAAGSQATAPGDQ